MNHYTSKTHSVVAWTWDDFMAYAREHAESSVDGVPWSFQLPGGRPVTHENDTRYLIAGVGDMSPNTVLVFYPRSKAWVIKNAEWFATEYIKGLPQRTVMDDCRSVDIRITSMRCGDRYFLPAVVEMLRKMADGLEADHNRDHFRPEHRPGWDTSDGVHTHIDPERGEITVEWSAAENEYDWKYEGQRASQIKRLVPPTLAAPGEMGPVIDAAQTKQELMEGLTDAERDALAWTVAADSFFWHFTSPGGDMTVSVDREPTQTVDEATKYCIQLLRSREIIGQDDSINVKLGVIHAIVKHPVG